MPPAKRGRRRAASNTPLLLAKRLPIALRTLDAYLGWDDAGRSRYLDYEAAVLDWLFDQPGVAPSDQLALAVANAAGCGPRDWYRVCLNPQFVK